MNDLNPIFNMVGVDTETSGLDGSKDEILEVCAVEFNSSGQIGRKISKMCRPMSGYIHPGATAANGITIDMVKDCPNYLTDGIREEIAEFIGNRTVIGHNVLAFDLKFLRITPVKVIDTLLMCRSKFKGGNNLKTACIRAGIEWVSAEAHRAEYDTLKCIELYCKMFISEEADRIRKLDIPLFAVPEDVKQIYASEGDIVKDLINIQEDPGLKLGVVISDKDKNMFATQAYSFSRLNLFNQCPFKWYMQYIKKYKEPDKSYFKTGKICHKAAEWAGEWCYRELFKNKVRAYGIVKQVSLSDETVAMLSEKYKKDKAVVDLRDLGHFIYEKPAMACVYFPEISRISDLIFTMDRAINHDDIEKPSMPDLASFNSIVENSINYYKCEDQDIIIEVKSIMNRFYTLKDFSQTPGDLTLTEKRLAFDSEWKTLNDFFSDKVFFRGIIDVLSYFGDYIIITDYKTSRKMLTAKELEEDRQMMIYVLLACKFMPKGSFTKIIVRIEYIRYGETVEYEITNPEEVAERALKWVNATIENIEKEMLKSDGLAFQPTRNEYCHTCFLGEDGMCPLFNKLISGKLEDPFSCSVSSIEECKAAWKRIETNKAENTRLTKLCKVFIEQCQDPIIIDKTAKLDFFVTKSREYDTKKTVLKLLEKGIKMSDFISYFSIAPSDLKRLLEDKDITPTISELDMISRVKSKSTFDAYTSEEAKSKGCINS